MNYQQKYLKYKQKYKKQLENSTHANTYTYSENLQSNYFQDESIAHLTYKYVENDKTIDIHIIYEWLNKRLTYKYNGITFIFKLDDSFIIPDMDELQLKYLKKLLNKIYKYLKLDSNTYNDTLKYIIRLL